MVPPVAPVLTLVAFLALSLAEGVTLDKDGGYVNLVIKVGGDDDLVPEEDCPEILANLKKLMAEGSHALYEALDQTVFFNSVTVVIPSTWRDSMCQTVVRGPRGRASPHRVPQVRVTAAGRGLPQGDLPRTQQSRSGCRQPGDVIDIPYTFLMDWNTTWQRYGDPAKLLVKEWSKFRYGVFDEHGFSGDPLYPNYFRLPDGRILPTGTSNDQGSLVGQWVTTEASGPSQACNPGEQEGCYFKPSETQNSHINCSLGYLHFLPSVRKFCHPAGGGTPAEVPPTKHNVLCGGRSAREVIGQHEDFVVVQRRLEEDAAAATPRVVNLEPTIRVVREPDPQYVLVMEKSAEMDSGGQWKWINKAAQKFIRYDLPATARLAVVTFGSNGSAKLEHPLVQVSSDDVRARLADTVPDKYHLGEGKAARVTEGLPGGDLGRGASGLTSPKCLLCGIQKAVHDVLRNNLVGGTHLVLITRGAEDTLTISDEQTIIEYVKYYDLRVSSILVPDPAKSPLAFYDSIAQMSGGSSHLVQPGWEGAGGTSARPISVYLDLMDAFSGLLGDNLPQPVPAAVVVHQALLEDTGMSSKSTGNFRIYSTLGLDSKFGIYVNDGEDHLIKSVTFADFKGNVYGPYTSLSSLYDIINLKTINYPIDEVPPFDDPELLDTEWQYDIEWYSGGGFSSLQSSAVRLTSRPRYGEDEVKVKVWTNSDSSADLVMPQNPLAVFAQLTKGPSPVLDAEVTLTVTVRELGGIGTVGFPNEVTTSYQMALRDNGNGDADLVAGDGIYSAYLTQFPAAGRYTFSVTAKDNGKAAFVIRQSSRRRSLSQSPPSDPFGGTSRSEELFSPCCGSRVTVRTEDRVPTGSFSRKSATQVLHLLSVPQGGDDWMPPSRISDLLVQVEAPFRWEAAWTAPGDDFDEGPVTGYRFLVADNYSHLLDPQSSKRTLVGFSRPPDQAAGARASYRFPEDVLRNLTVSDGTTGSRRYVYVALVAFDEADNEGKVSNIVALPLIGATEAGGGSGGDPGTESLEPWPGGIQAVEAEAGFDQATLIGALCGSVAVMALLLWAGIWYFRGRTLKKIGGTRNGGVTASLVVAAETSSATGGSQHDGTGGAAPDRRNDFWSTASGYHQFQFGSQTKGVIARNVGDPGGQGGLPNTPEYGFNGEDASRALEQPPPGVGGLHHPDDTPIYWSASQLLAEHELYSSSRISGANANANANGGLDPIPEEFFDQDVDAHTYAQGLANYGYHTRVRHQSQKANSKAASSPLLQTTSTPLQGASSDLAGTTLGRAGGVSLSENLIVGGVSGPQQLHEPVYVAYSPDSARNMYGCGIGRGVQAGVPPLGTVAATPNNNVVAPLTDCPYLGGCLPPQGLYSEINSGGIYSTSSKRSITHV